MALFHTDLESQCQPSLKVATRIALKDSEGNQETLKELITDTPLEGSNHCLLVKSAFLFRDQVIVADEALYVDECKWFREVESV